jgi:hypothetical protein
MTAPTPDLPPKGPIVLDSDDGVIVIFEGPGDTTPKPRPPHIPPYDPRAIPPGLLRGRQPPPPQPPEKGD